MRKSLKAILLGAAVTALLCVSALAAEPATTEGFHSLGTATGVSVEVQTAGGGSIEAEAANVDGEDVNDFYADGVRMKVTYTGELVEGDQYLVMLVTGDALPTAAASICYIDQKAESDAKEDGLEFDVFPKLPTKSTEMTLYLTSNADGFTRIAIPVSYAGQPYKLGDVDMNDFVNSGDALWVLQYAASNRSFTDLQKTLGDVDKNGAINSGDALWILQASAGNRVLE